MKITLPKKLTLKWTQHIKEKMRHYGLSESRVKRVMNHPARREVGIAPHTLAAMQPITKKMKPSTSLRYRTNGGRNPLLKAYGKSYGPTNQHDMLSSTERKTTQEIWVMYQDRGATRTMITAWRYPGKSPVRGAVPIPDDIRNELGIPYTPTP